MCGIFGYIGRNAKNVPVDEIKRLLYHRGPDANGSVVLEGAAFIHTRLSIIDLSPKGRQPMSNADQTVWIVYNGEIYNYIELKHELSGYPFQTSTDTEVILAAYEKWGEKFITRLRGMFSFGLYDSRKNRLICAVDRFGIKPFYYFMDQERFIFSSEIKPLKAAGVPLEPDDKTIYDYMVYGLLQHNSRTFFKNINQLRPAQYMVYKKGSLNISQYWDLSEEEDENDQCLVSCAELADEKLKESIALHLRSDVEYGLSLSSGLDSNILRCMISELMNSNKRLQCFSFCYTGTVYDECSCFREDSDEIGIRYNKSNITSKNLFYDLPEIIRAQESPIGGAGIYAFWHNMKLASDRGIRVILNGQGADEIFCGYKYYYENWLAEIYEKGDTALLQKEISLFNQQHETDFIYPGKDFEQLVLSCKDNIAAKASDGTSLNAHGYLSDEFLRRNKQTPIQFPHKFKSNTKNAMYADLFYKKIPKLLRFQDKCSMCWGVEVRVPFLDHVLVENIFPFPVKVLLSDGETKSLLRQVSLKYKDAINSLYSKRIKKYMPTPQREWLKYELVEQIKELINSSVLHDRGYIDKHLLMIEYDNYIRQELLANSFFIWKFINLEFIFRIFFKKDNF